MASSTTEFGARVPTEEYEFFREQFPQYGASTWFITEALKKFNEEVRQNPSVKDHINSSIQQMLESNRGAASTVGTRGA